MPNPTTIGIDVGGTAIKGGLVAADGTVLARETIPTEAKSGPVHVIARMAELVRRIAGANKSGPQPTGVGLGMPGALNRKKGVIYSPPNLPGWNNVPIVDDLSKATGRSVVLENDANCAALAEYKLGAGHGTTSMILLTLGTGVGGGTILNGELWHGNDDGASEWGHVIVQINGRRCNCGQHGCLEAYASATNTAARATELIRGGRPSTMTELLNQNGQLTSQDVLEAADRGDAAAQEIWQETCTCLAVACINIRHAVSPQRIVLAGGMSAAGSKLLNPILAAIKKMGFSVADNPPDVQLAKLGNDAGFIGAALNAHHAAGSL